MRRSALLLVVLAACGDDDGDGDAPAGLASDDAVARRVFEALQRDDLEHFEILLPLKTDLDPVLENKDGAALITRVRRSTVKGFFADAREAGAKVLDWSQAEYGGVDAAKSSLTKEPQGGARPGWIVFRVREGGKTREVRLEGFKGPRGWFISENMMFLDEPS